MVHSQRRLQARLLGATIAVGEVRTDVRLGLSGEHEVTNDKGTSGSRILGIDPGLITTGYGLIEAVGGELKLVEGGIIRVPTKLPLEQRLSVVFHGVQELIREFEPSAIALEEVYTHYERPRVAVMMGHARGVICLAAALNQVPLFSYASTHVKGALTGNGRASKEQVQRMVEIRLDLKKTPEPPDVSDALAVALCHLVRSKTNAEQLAALVDTRDKLLERGFDR